MSVRPAPCYHMFINICVEKFPTCFLLFVTVFMIGPSTVYISFQLPLKLFKINRDNYPFNRCTKMIPPQQEWRRRCLQSSVTTVEKDAARKINKAKETFLW